VDVLMERDGSGRAPDFSEVSVEAIAAGEMARVEVAAHDGRRLIARRAA
jgi:hypothetical protein